MVSPHAVTNLEFTKTLAKVLNRVVVLPVPEFVLKILPGNIAGEMFLADNCLKSAKLDIIDYEFRYADLEGALRPWVKAFMNLDQATGFNVRVNLSGRNV